MLLCSILHMLCSHLHQLCSCSCSCSRSCSRSCSLTLLCLHLTSIIEWHNACAKRSPPIHNTYTTNSSSALNTQMVRKTLQTSQTDNLSLQPMPVLIYVQLVRTKSSNQPFSFFIQITHLSARFGCQPCNDKLVRLSLQTIISILYLVRTHLQTRIKILHLVRTSLQTRDLHSISILYFTLCCSIWIYQPSNAISISHATLCYSKLFFFSYSETLCLISNNLFRQRLHTFTFIWSSPTSRSISPALHPRRPGWPHQSRWYLKFSQCM